MLLQMTLFHSVLWPSNFPGGTVVKNQPINEEMQKIQVQSLGQKDPLE